MSGRSRLAGLACVGLLLAVPVAGHAASSDDDMCRNGLFPREEGQPVRLGLARVGGAGQLRFLEDMGGCPNEEARCRQRAYVVVGDQVLTGRVKGPYVCAFYPNAGGGSAGWVRRDRLTPLPAEAAPPLRAWAGRWAYGDNGIRLTVKGDMLVAEGDAYWPSANPPLSVRPGGPNVGEMSGAARPRGDRVVFSDGEPGGCVVTLRLVGPWLVADDNNRCGGMNVSFAGVYRRR